MRKEVLDPEDLKPKAGELVEAWINEKLIPFIKAREIVDVGPNGFYTEGRKGTVVRYRSEPPFRGHFVTSATEAELRVSPGLVDGAMPSIKGIFLDGTSRAKDGKLIQGDAPVLKIEPPEVEHSFACIKLLTDAKGAPATGEEDYLTIIHAPEPLSDLRRELGDRFGIWPLARLKWGAKQKLIRVRQITYHNLAHFYIPGGGARPSFHDFRAAG